MYTPNLETGATWLLPALQGRCLLAILAYIVEAWVYSASDSGRMRGRGAADSRVGVYLQALVYFVFPLVG